MFLYVLPHFLYADYTADHFLKDTSIFNADDFTICVYEKAKMLFRLCPNDDFQQRLVIRNEFHFKKTQQVSLFSSI